MKDFQGEIKADLDNLHSTLLTVKEDSKMDLARVHMAIALQLMQGGVGDVNCVNMNAIQNLLLTSPQPTTRSPTDVTTTTIDDAAVVVQAEDPPSRVRGQQALQNDTEAHESMWFDQGVVWFGRVSR